MRGILWSVLAGAALAALAAPGCFSERSDMAGPGGTELCDGVQRPAVVVIRDFEFVPASLTVASGTEVTFVNCGPTAHSATADDFEWDSDLLPTGATFRRTFTAPGTEPYHCEPHPFMQGTITVG